MENLQKISETEITLDEVIPEEKRVRTYTYDQLKQMREDKQKELDEIDSWLSEAKSLGIKSAVEIKEI